MERGVSLRGLVHPCTEARARGGVHMRPCSVARPLQGGSDACSF